MHSRIFNVSKHRACWGDQQLENPMRDYPEIQFDQSKDSLHMVQSSLNITISWVDHHSFSSENPYMETSNARRHDSLDPRLNVL